MKLLKILFASLCFVWLLSSCKSPIEPELSPTEIDVIAGARVSKIMSKETSLFGQQYESKVLAELEKSRYNTYIDEYNTDSRISQSFVVDYNNSPITLGKYQYSGQFILYRPGGSNSFFDTLQINASGHVLNNRDNKNSTLFFPSGKYQYNKEGYLTREDNQIYQQDRERNATISLLHSYLNGNRTETIVYLFDGNKSVADDPDDSAIITYEYNLSKYNPNLPDDDYNVFGDWGMWGDFFVKYAKRHFSLYGRLNRNLIVSAKIYAHNSRQLSSVPYEECKYKYTFDDKKRVKMIEVVGKTVDAMQLSKRIVEYSE